MRDNCEFCNKETKTDIKEGKVNHILHLLLSMATMGIWLIVWIILSMKAKNTYSCSVCGTKSNDDYFPEGY